MVSIRLRKPELNSLLKRKSSGLCNRVARLDMLPCGLNLLPAAGKVAVEDGAFKSCPGQCLG